jgi:hypothetical protein
MLHVWNIHLDLVYFLGVDVGRYSMEHWGFQCLNCAKRLSARLERFQECEASPDEVSMDWAREIRKDLQETTVFIMKLV